MRRVREQAQRDELEPREEALLGLLVRAEGPRSAADLRAALSWAETATPSPQAVGRSLQELARLGLARRIPGRPTLWETE